MEHELELIIARLEIDGKIENPKICRKFQILKMTQKSFSAYPKIPKSDFSKFIDFLNIFPHFYPPWGALLVKWV